MRNRARNRTTSRLAFAAGVLTLVGASSPACDSDGEGDSIEVVVNVTLNGTPQPCDDLDLGATLIRALGEFYPVPCDVAETGVLLTAPQATAPFEVLVTQRYEARSVQLPAVVAQVEVRATDDDLENRRIAVTVDLVEVDLRWTLADDIPCATTAGYDTVRIYNENVDLWSERLATDNYNVGCTESSAIILARSGDPLRVRLTDELGGEGFSTLFDNTVVPDGGGVVSVSFEP